VNVIPVENEQFATSKTPELNNKNLLSLLLSVKSEKCSIFALVMRHNCVDKDIAFKPTFITLDIFLHHCQSLSIVQAETTKQCQSRIANPLVDEHISYLVFFSLLLHEGGQNTVKMIQNAILQQNALKITEQYFAGTPSEGVAKQQIVIDKRSKDHPHTHFHRTELTPHLEIWH